MYSSQLIKTIKANAYPRPEGRGLRRPKKSDQAVFSESFEQFGLFSREFLIAENALGAQVGKAFDQGEEVALVSVRWYRVAVGPHP